MIRWEDSAFLAEARAWIESEVTVTGAIEQVHVRPWSTVLRAPTDRGDVFFKASLAGLAHDVVVTSTLARLRPDLVLAPIAVNLDRGWMLLPDGGERLRELIEREPHPRPWFVILPEYADLQLASAGELDCMIEQGLPDLRLERMPELVERLAAELGEPAPPNGTAQLCAELAAVGIPETIQHDDLHDGNVFVVDGGYRIFDWGDSVAEHPLLSLVVAPRGVAYRFELGEHDPDIERLRDAYLDRFAAYGTLAELRDAASLAEPLGMLGRAWSWWRVASSVDHPGEFSEAAREWFRDFVAAMSG
jgi:Phosphotransferase enzyme family